MIILVKGMNYMKTISVWVLRMLFYTFDLSGRRVLLVQKSVCTGEAGVEEAAVAVGTCKGSLNRRWGCSGKTLRRSSQFSASTRMECSNGEFSKVLR